MTIAQVRNNIYATSSQQTVTNILPKPGTTTPDYWYPSANDKTPSLRINMPDVDELMPDDYDIMSVEIKAVNFESVTVKVTDAANRVIVDVSYFASFAVNYNYHWQRGDYCRGLPLAAATAELDKLTVLNQLPVHVTVGYVPKTNRYNKFRQKSSVDLREKFVAYYI